MSVSFPVSEHTPLSNPPLTEVVCQVRFPVNLKLLKEPPADFQEIIADRFPAYSVERGLQINVSADLSQRSNPGEFPSVSRFHNKEETQAVSLASDFYALSTT